MGYMRITGFQEETADELRDALMQLAEERDARGDSGFAVQSGRAAEGGGGDQRYVFDRMG